MQKDRLVPRLTDKSLELVELVRRGEGTETDALQVRELLYLSRVPVGFPKILDRHPILEGKINKLVAEGLFYKDRALDFLESQFPVPEVEEDSALEEDSLFITETGKMLLDWLSHWRELPPPFDEITYFLDRFKKGEKVFYWALKGLVRDGYLKKEEI